MGVVLIGSSKVKDPNKIEKGNQNWISLAARSEVARRFTSWLQVLLILEKWLGLAWCDRPPMPQAPLGMLICQVKGEVQGELSSARWGLVECGLVPGGMHSGFQF